VPAFCRRTVDVVDHFGNDARIIGVALMDRAFSGSFVDERRVTVDAHKETCLVMLTALRNLLRSVVHDEVDAPRHRYAMVLRKPHGLL